jgi:hypothetical protein
MFTNQLGTPNSYLGNIGFGRQGYVGAATIHFTQGARDGGTGQSAINFVAGVPVILTDDGGPGATSYTWEVLNWPGPGSGAPAITNPTAQIAYVTPPGDGSYLVKLTRVDGVITTTDTRFFAVADADGLSLPTAGITGRMANIGSSPLLAQAAGWMGRSDAGTNVMLDAYLRWLKGRMGAYTGKAAAHASSGVSPVTTPLVVGIDPPFQTLTITGTGAYTFELSTTGATQGDAFWIRVDISAGAGSVTLKSGIGGSTILTLPAPPAGMFSYYVSVSYNSGWSVIDVTTPELNAMPQTVEIPGVSGIQQTALQVFSRIGTLRVDPSKYPASVKAYFWAFLEVTAGMEAQCQLVNLTSGGAVSGSTLVGDQEVSTYYEAPVTLPSAARDYEVQLLMTAAGLATDQVGCSSAGIKLVWR